MVLWTDSTKTTVCETAPSTLPTAPTLTDLDRQVIVNRVMVAQNRGRVVTPVPTVYPCGCTGTRPCPTCLDEAHFKADLYFEIRDTILEALAFTTETGAVDVTEYETTRG
jgi:hypothetical protein